jgi:hypothetical protein
MPKVTRTVVLGEFVAAPPAAEAEIDLAGLRRGWKAAPFQNTTPSK